MNRKLKMQVNFDNDCKKLDIEVIKVKLVPTNANNKV